MPKMCSWICCRFFGGTNAHQKLSLSPRLYAAAGYAKKVVEIRLSCRSVSATNDLGCASERLGTPLYQDEKWCFWHERKLNSCFT